MSPSKTLAKSHPIGAESVFQKFKAVKSFLSHPCPGLTWAPDQTMGLKKPPPWASVFSSAPWGTPQGMGDALDGLLELRHSPRLGRTCLLQGFVHWAEMATEQMVPSLNTPPFSLTEATESLLGHRPYLQKKDSLRAEQAVSWRPYPFIFLQTRLEKKEKFHSSTSNFRRASIFVEFWKYFLTIFFLKNTGTPHQVYCPKRLVLHISASLSTLLKEMKKTIADFPKGALTAEIWALPLWPRSLRLHPQVRLQNHKLGGVGQRRSLGHLLLPQQTATAPKPTPSKRLSAVWAKSVKNYSDDLFWCLAAFLNQEVLSCN